MAKRIALCCLFLVACSWCSWRSPAMALRRVLVTGGNKGIGRALCRQLAADHGFYVLLGSRDPGRGEEAVKSILEKSPECQDRLEFLPLDVASDASVKAAAETVREKFGTMYAIVNNAGVGFQNSMADTLNINTYGPKRVCDHFLPLLDPKEGRIVNTASASGPNYNAGAPAAEREMLTNPVTWHRLGAGGCSTPQLGKTMETHGKPMGNPWETHGKPMGNPMGNPMGKPETDGNPWGKSVLLAENPQELSRCSVPQPICWCPKDVTWEELSATMEKVSKDPGGRQPYGFSKACLIAYTMMLAREKPELKINAMTPGYILTDITRGMGATKPPEEGTKAAIYCLTRDLKGNGWYYGSDALRSPIDRYRAPGDPPYEGP